MISTGMLVATCALGLRVMADAGTDVAVVNPTFTGTGSPEGWSEQPGAKNAGSSIAIDPAGGVHMVDADTGNGLGLGQWVPVIAGHKYQCTIESKGTGSMFLDLMFLPKKPVQMASLNKDKLGEVKSGIGKTPDFAPMQAEGVAPAGTTTAFIWLYSPKAGVCDVVVKSVKLTDLGDAGGAAPAATPGAASAPAAAQGTTPAPAAAPAPPTTYVAPADPVAAATTTATAAEYGHAPAPPETIGEPKFGNPNSVPAGSLPKGIVQVVDFEPGDISQASWNEGHRKEMSTDVVRSGKYAIKIDLLHGQKRSEVSTQHVEAYGEFKYGWSIYLPQDFDDKTWFSIVTQWHSYGTGKEYKPDGGPPTSITINKNQMSLKLQFQDGATEKCTHQNFPISDVDSMRGKWTDFVVEANWQSPQTGGGYFRLYKNGEKVVDYTGPTWFDGKTIGPYFKVGIYRGSVPWKGDERTSILYFDELRVGGHGSTIADVDPAQQKGSPAGATVAQHAPATAPTP